MASRAFSAFALLAAAVGARLQAPSTSPAHAAHGADVDVAEGLSGLIARVTSLTALLNEPQQTDDFGNAMANVSDWVTSRIVEGRFPEELERGAILTALTFVALSSTATAACIDPALDMVRALVAGASANEPVPAEQLHFAILAVEIFSGSHAVNASQRDAMLSALAGIVDAPGWRSDAQAAKLIARALWRLAVRADKATPNAAAFYERLIQVCDRGFGTFHAEDADFDVISALAQAAQCKTLSAGSLRRAVEIIAFGLRPARRPAPLHPREAMEARLRRRDCQDTMARMLVSVAEHPAVTGAILSAVVDVTSRMETPRRLEVLNTVSRCAGKDAVAKRGDAAEVTLATARSFVLSRRILGVADSHLKPGHSFGGDELCPPLIALIGELPLPMAVAAPALRSLPTAVLGVVGEFATSPTTEGTCLEAVEACMAVALSGDFTVARALWRAACAPIPAVAAAAAEAFSVFADQFGFLYADVIRPQDLVDMARCLRPRGGSRGRDAFEEPETARHVVAKAQSLLHGAAALLRSWPNDSRDAAEAALREMCVASAEVATVARDRSRDELADDALAHHLLFVCGQEVVAGE